MLEWWVKILKALIDGRFTGDIKIRFKDGGISSLTKPKEEKKANGLRLKQIIPK